MAGCARYPISNEFPLLGKRAQLFQRQLLELDADGSVSTATILDPSVLPITHIDGMSLPTVDPDLLSSASLVDTPDYVTNAQAFVNMYVPDTWNGVQVSFLSTFTSSVTCDDAFGTNPCDPSVLPAVALELWGLPTSLPTLDPLNSDFVSFSEDIGDVEIVCQSAASSVAKHNEQPPSARSKEVPRNRR